MKYLVGLGVGQKVYWRALDNFGPHTQRKLEKRGCIEASFELKKNGVLDEIWLTAKGLEDWKARKKHYETYICL